MTGEPPQCEAGVTEPTGFKTIYRRCENPAGHGPGYYCRLHARLAKRDGRDLRLTYDATPEVDRYPLEAVPMWWALMKNPKAEPVRYP